MVPLFVNFVKRRGDRGAHRRKFAITKAKSKYLEMLGSSHEARGETPRVNSESPGFIFSRLEIQI